MTTAGKLWLGFGTLIAVLVLSSAAIVLRVGAIDSAIQQMGQARDRSAIASQLEIGLLSYVLAIRTYVQTGAAQSVQDAAQNFEAVEYHLQRYRDLADSEHQRLMAEEFATLWQELKVLGTALNDADNHRVTAEQSNRLHTIGAHLKALLNTQMQADAVRTHAYRRALAQDDAQDVARFALLLLVIGTLVALVTSAAVAREVVRSEHDLRSSREKLRVTLASIGDAVVTTDNAATVTYLNPMAARLGNVATADAIGRPLQSCFHLIDTATRAQLDRLAPPGQTPSSVTGHSGEALLIGLDGSERAVDYSVTPIRDEDARVTGMALTFRDVTERNRLEGQLRAHATALSEADRRKDEFLAMLAHELRNPLAPLQNALEAMAHTDSTAQGRAASVSMMQRQLRHVVRLVDDLLDISRISRGEIALRMEDIELASIIDDAVEVAMPICQAQGHRLSLLLPPRPVRLRADPIRLAQILGNLLNNACKFTPRGGHVELRAQAHDGRIEIRVRDNGIGIAKDMLSPIFDMFFQADIASERVENGSGIGLGLSLVRKLTELHGGSVSASSAGAGQGSEFVVHLPAAIDAGERQAALSEADDAAGAVTPLRILIVDDNRDAAASLAALMELNGHHIRTASDGNAAMDFAATWHPQVILLDIGLPGFSGLEVARRIRAEPWGGAIKLVAVTGWSQDSDRQRSRAAGFDAHLVKPVAYSELISILAESGT